MQHLTEDAKAILLLCGRFNSDKNTKAEKPLSLGEYNRLADWMVKGKLRPADLLKSPPDTETLGATVKIDALRIQGLLSRGAAMALAVEKWSHSGIWIVCRSDAQYPSRLKKHLKRQAPPVLFGVGDIGLLSPGGLAIVGSRNVDDEGEAFTRKVARACVDADMAVVSGGARGVDQVAMLSALAAGGKAVGILADSLQKAALAGKYRQAIREKRLVLVSPFHPGSRFNVGNAMGRNKYIYALADFALIISAEIKKGGTWAGATEELKREERRPVFVRTGKGVPPGNPALLEMGAQPFPEPPWKGDVKNLLAEAEPPVPGVRKPSQRSLFGGERRSAAVAMVKEEPAAFKEAPEKTGISPIAAAADGESEPRLSIYDAALPVLLAAMENWISSADLAGKLDVRKGQLDDWLKRAVEEGVIEKKTRPVRFRRKQETQ
ncbi:DNA-processing protein DprA [Desulfosarcina alkanivorans]|nr:DNA-processing protein DprA [Desulfosarcina alkanivorans]